MSNQEEIAGLYVRIQADMSGLLLALDTTRASLQALAAEGGLLGALPSQTMLQAGAMVAGVQAALAPLPGSIQAGLLTPFQSAIKTLPEALAPLPEMLQGGVTAPTAAVLDDIAGMIAARGAQLIAQMHALAAQIRAAASNLNLGGGAPTPIPGRAAGGPVASGQPYLVGEAGPELFVPGRSGNIIPNHALAGEAGPVIRGGTFHFYGVQDPEALYDELRRVAEHRAP